jgi:hypothetical protein
MIMAIRDPAAHHWVGIFLDVDCQSMPVCATATIYNSFGASDTSSKLAPTLSAELGQPPTRSWRLNISSSITNLSASGIAQTAEFSSFWQLSVG